MGILRQLFNIQQHSRMAQRCWFDTADLHAVELRRTANAKDKKSLLVGMSHCRGDHDMSRIYHTLGSESRTMLRPDHT